MSRRASSKLLKPELSIRAAGPKKRVTSAGLGSISRRDGPFRRSGKGLVAPFNPASCLNRLASGRAHGFRDEMIMGYG